MAPALDLVMAITGKSFRDAIAWLDEQFLRTATPAAAKTNPLPSTPLPPPAPHTLPECHPSAHDAVRRYLCGRRGIPATLVDPLLSAGLIYGHIHHYDALGSPRSFTNAVFLMRHDITAEPTGSMIRGCYDGRSPRKSTLPLPNSEAAASGLEPNSVSHGSSS